MDGAQKLKHSKVNLFARNDLLTFTLNTTECNSSHRRIKPLSEQLHRITSHDRYALPPMKQYTLFE